jgi:hypothetical protein
MFAVIAIVGIVVVGSYVAMGPENRKKFWSKGL